ncbi:MAG: TetR family transcriptional regulator [Maricaulis sp.]|jgi:AcrR family transcriptional regulator|nr:TetR family transcriptional regulator [Maricaulis sp.]MAL10563.1 TetR family transcriptional regulator [Maricaulis sp.]HAQ36806.1 TetR family transcriptional regulator [Alphaproteobacteria bacterium]|tara:strand:+ start:381 stop:989 length:609 start_codon:yes stop_codon:yes gene_type:complete
MSTSIEQAPLKGPKTARGERTRAKLLDAAEREFGENGFHSTSIGEITRRAKVALGTFYVYFDSKDEIFRALVEHMGRTTRSWLAERVVDASNRLEAERLGIMVYIDLVRAHRDLHRIVMESQFVAPDAYRNYYDTFVDGYRRNLTGAVKRGEITPGDAEVRAWALMGMNTFLGLKYGIWDDSRSSEEIAAEAAALITEGMTP